MKKSKRKKTYYIEDLANIAAILNGRIKFDIVPVEMIQPAMLLPPAKKDKPEKK